MAKKHRSLEPIHEWFGLTYSNYLVMPRLAMQSMPLPWQEKMVALLNQVNKKFPRTPEKYTVQVRGKAGGFVRDPWSDYRHGDADALCKEKPHAEG